MKDSYTFDRDAEGLDAQYQKHVQAYDRMFDRCGLEWYRVEADVGMMGGLGAHEYMAPCAAGENDVALAAGYAANVEVASADAQPVSLPPPLDAPEEVHTPGMTTIDAIARALDVRPGATLKAYPIIVGDDSIKLVVLRGDHRVNEIKLRVALGEDFRPARPEEVQAAARAAGLHRSGRRADADPARPGGHAGWPTWSAPTVPTCICAASSPAATSSSRPSTSATSSPATPSTDR